MTLTSGRGFPEMPPVPDEIWRANLDAVAAALDE
jgi:hypothetical protein